MFANVEALGRVSLSGVFGAHVLVVMRPWCWARARVWSSRRSEKFLVSAGLQVMFVLHCGCGETLLIKIITAAIP